MFEILLIIGLSIIIILLLLVLVVALGNLSWDTTTGKRSLKWNWKPDNSINRME